MITHLTHEQGQGKYSNKVQIALHFGYYMQCIQMPLEQTTFQCNVVSLNILYLYVNTLIVCGYIVTHPPSREP